MPRLQRTTVVDQIAESLRKDIRRGRWAGRLPGAMKLAAELDVAKESVMAALAVLEEEGTIRSRGVGKAREVVSGEGKGAGARRRLRVGILPYEDPRHSPAFKQRQLLNLAHEIEAAGHTPFFAPKSQLALKGDVARIGAMVKAVDADVWVVLNALQEVPAWLRAHGVPAVAIGGRGEPGMPTAAYCPTDAMCEALARLVALGHRRIVLVCPRNWRLPEQGPYVRLFLDTLKASGIPAGEYNVPDWTESPAGFTTLLRSLFSITPPTALIVGDARQAMAVTTFLSSRGMRVGRDVSLVVRVPDSALEWADPSVAHFAFDEELIVKRVVRRLAGVAKGESASGTELLPMTFVDGTTVGPVPTSAA